MTLGVLALTGKPIRLPIWAVAEIEARGNAALSKDMPGAAFAIGGVEITVESDWTPRLRIEDLRLLQGRGATLIALPDVRLVFDATSLVTEAKLRPRSLRIIGGSVALQRQGDGTLDLQFGNVGDAPKVKGLNDLLVQVDRALQAPFLSRLRLVEAEAASLSLKDAMTGRLWTVGDGRLRLDVKSDQLAAEVGLSLVEGGEAPAQAVVTLIRPKDEARIRLTASVEQVSSRDIAAQAPILSWLGVLAAPISGRISAELSDEGLEALDAEMSLSAGALQPQGTARPISFDRAAIRLGYDPSRGRILLSDLSVESPSLRLKAKGHSYPLDSSGNILTGPIGRRLPAGFLGQVQISDAQIDPEGLFERPLIFREGAMDARLQLDPFKLDIGQITLIEERARRLSLSGKAMAQSDGWQVALDLALDAIAHDRLLQLWPKTLVPKTRDWVGQNVANGLLTNLNAALRLVPGQEPKLALGYEFDDAEVSFLRTLPPIQKGRGRSTVEGKTYQITLDEGEVEAPLGGRINAAGSTFKVPDVTAKPARAEIRLKTESTITAALSLLDLPPFGFMTKAGRPADLGEGQAIVDTFLSLPLQRRVQLEDVEYRVNGTLGNVASDKLIAGKTVTANALALQADPSGLTISGPGKVGEARFDVAFRQGFGAEAKGRARIDGTVELSPAALKEFNVQLPSGMLSGTGKGEISLNLVKDAAPTLELKTDLSGIGMRIDAIGWTLPAKTKGKLELQARLGSPPEVSKLDLVAPGLKAIGNIDLEKTGGLRTATFSEVTVGNWMEGAVQLKGKGKNANPDVVVSSGVIDLRKFEAPKSGEGGSQNASSIDVRLDRLVVTDGIALTGFQGKFGLRGGFNGQFVGSVNGSAAVQGEAVPSRHGTAIRVTSQSAGAVLRSAGVFSSARGGELTLRLTPRSDRVSYDGRAKFTNVRVRKTNALAELLSAISVVGLLEQLNGSGILFSEAVFDLVLTPQAVQISNGAAMGASLGVSVEGLYGTKTKKLALQGVVSPIYLVNGVGAALTRRGEGLFGFNYAVRGTSDDPKVQVNPLSILTPGMFREIFRSPAPTLDKKTQ
ncbi:AsmA-like C-terminal region-containing protein [Thioclava sp. FR2]|uniref:AsmA-like C-terminal region-containing protein n=1 Tax=Thioclava sp. FR2 TaxID=3445780 RepID=UPI003EBB0A6D